MKRDINMGQGDINSGQTDINMGLTVFIFGRSWIVGTNISWNFPSLAQFDIWDVKKLESSRRGKKWDSANSGEKMLHSPIRRKQ